MAFSFGQSSAAQGGFSFGQSSGGLFGNTAASSESLFGNTGAASAPAFGASSSSFNLFGSQASQSNLFGSSTPAVPNIFAQAAASGSSSGFSFGQSSGGLFGSSKASSGGLFGAPQPASSSSLFGSTQTFGGFGAQAPSTSNLFGQQQAPQQNQIVPAGYTSGISGQPDFSALREIEAIAAAYDPANPKYRFNHLFLNVVDNPASRLKPNDVDELQWRGAIQRAGGIDNPDRLWPVQAKGFKDLLARKQAQDQAIKEYAERLDAAEQSAKRLQRRQQALLKERIDLVQRKHAELSHRLLKICRHIDVLEGRLAMAQDYWSSAPAETVNKLSELLRVVEQTMQYHSAGGLQKKVEALAAAARLKADAPVVQSEMPGVDGESLKQIFGIVSQQATAIERLQGVIKRTSRDLAILEAEDRAVVAV